MNQHQTTRRFTNFRPRFSKDYRRQAWTEFDTDSVVFERFDIKSARNSACRVIPAVEVYMNVVTGKYFHHRCSPVVYLAENFQDNDYLTKRQHSGVARIRRASLMRHTGVLSGKGFKEILDSIEMEHHLKAIVSTKRVMKLNSSTVSRTSTIDEEDANTGPKGTFATYLAEGEGLFRNGNFKKALTSFDLALEKSPGNLIGLVARSKCHLQLGDSNAALKDAEASLENDENNHRGVFAKAEALYQQGDFEFALVYFHRGRNLRPELQEFRLGIQKSQEAIDNCVGKPSSCKLQAKGDLSFFNKAEEKGKPVVITQYNCPKKPVVKGRREGHSHHATGGRATKVVLGELYKDKEYLEKLINDEDLVKGSHAGVNIYDLVLSGIQYLDTRSEFWRQQQPLYARNRDRLEFKRKWSSHPDKEPEPTAFILKNLEKIDAYLADGKGEDSLQLANDTLVQVEAMSLEMLPNKDDVVANLQSCLGNAYLELGDYELALHHHQEDLEISQDLQFLDAKSRALDNLGRVHARAGDFQNAIDCWEEKLPLSRSALESTWLYHEIGRCYLELDNCDKAMENGELSLDEAKKAKDQVWQLNASVLIAQAQVKVDDYAKAIESFRYALSMAKRLKDVAAETAVTKALEDVNIKRSKQFRRHDQEEVGKEGSDQGDGSDNDDV